MDTEEGKHPERISRRITIKNKKIKKPKRGVPGVQNLSGVKVR